MTVGKDEEEEEPFISATNGHMFVTCSQFLPCINAAGFWFFPLNLAVHFLYLETIHKVDKRELHQVAAPTGSRLYLRTGG